MYYLQLKFYSLQIVKLFYSDLILNMKKGLFRFLGRLLNCINS